MESAAFKKMPARLRNALKVRANPAETGHVNERRVLVDDQGVVPVGPTTPQDTRMLIRDQLGSDKEILKASNWYKDFAHEIEHHVGAAEADKWKIAHALTQANDSPTSGVRNVLIAERQAAGLPERTSAGMADAPLGEVMRGQQPSRGFDSKTADYADSLVENTTRSIMGNDIRTGAPAAVDRHEFRSAGYIDDTYLGYLRSRFGDAAAEGLQLDTAKSGVVNPKQYESISMLRQKTADYFNKLKFAGKTDWTPSQVQATNWVAFRKMLGLQSESPLEAFYRHYSTMPTELAWGTGSPASKVMPSLEALPFKTNRAITNDVLARILNHLAPQFKVRVQTQEMTTGGYGVQEGSSYQLYLNPSKRITLFGTDTAIQDLLNATHYFANQSTGIAYKVRYVAPESSRELLNPGESRSLVSGSTADTTGMDISCSRFADRAFLQSFTKRLSQMDSRFNGFTLERVEGVPAIRVINTNPEIVTSTNPNAPSSSVRGKWTAKDFTDMEKIIAKVADEMKVNEEIKTDWLGLNLYKTGNNWEARPYGEDYLAWLVKTGRPQVASQLAADTRKLLPEWTREAFLKYAPNVWKSKFGEKGFDWDAWNTAWGARSGIATGGPTLEQIFQPRPSAPVKPAPTQQKLAPVQQQKLAPIQSAKLPEVVNAKPEGWRANIPRRGIPNKNLGETLSSPADLNRGWLRPNGKAIKVDDHQASLARALNVDRDVAVANYPEMAATQNLIRILTRVRTKQKIAEIFTAPTDAQIRSIRAIEKASGQEMLFAVTDPVSKKLIGWGQGANNIRRVFSEIKAGKTDFGPHPFR